MCHVLAIPVVLINTPNSTDVTYMEIKYKSRDKKYSIVLIVAIGFTE